MEPFHRWNWAVLPLACAVLLSCGSRSEADDARRVDSPGSGVRPMATPLPAESGDASVAVTVRPGEPGAPSETVRAARRGDTCSLYVGRRNADGELIGEETVPLPGAAFARIWNSVLADEVYKFAPEEKPGEVFDYGERRVRVEWAVKGEPEPKAHDASWGRPIRNEEKVAAPIKQLAELAREHGKKVRLHYIRPK